MSNKKQTAVEWLESQINEFGKRHFFSLSELLEQAKEMEKEQVVDAFDFGIASVINKYDKAFSEIDGNEYYEEKYQK